MFQASVNDDTNKNPLTDVESPENRGLPAFERLTGSVVAPINCYNALKPSDSIWPITSYLIFTSTQVDRSALKDSFATCPRSKPAINFTS
jgi:hypothetical protein